MHICIHHFEWLNTLIYFLINLTKLRISAHILIVENGRYDQNRLSRNERFCTLYNAREIEGEFHFAIKCACYTDQISTFMKNYYYRRPSICKFIELVNSTNKHIIINSCNFSRRNFLIKNIVNGNLNNAQYVRQLFYIRRKMTWILLSRKKLNKVL